MPTYEYQCDACGERFEKFQSMSATPVKKCPKCGKNKVRRLISAGAGILFKGSGFYITDYRDKSYTDKAKAETGAVETKSTETKTTETKTGERKSGDAAKPAAIEAKPAATTEAKPVASTESKPPTPKAASKSASKKHRK
ncbi:MAG: zinc ribbon domain-containing protein [Anaerolineae bacterium]|nr:zinc ribbon domain-containing protein [Phycisphaerae bacterium]